MVIYYEIKPGFPPGDFEDRVHRPNSDNLVCLPSCCCTHRREKWEHLPVWMETDTELIAVAQTERTTYADYDGP